jgi:diguanylate cyclase (GGDEF)-like protein/PAS domain S-box-containing protein
MAGSSATTQASLSDDRFRALVEDLPAVTYIADFVGTFTLRYVSPQIEQAFGYTAERWIKDEMAWVEALHPADRDRIVAEAEARIAAVLPFDFEYRLMTADGRERWVWEKTAIQRDEDGRPVAVNGVMIDVTDLRLAQEALLHEAERRSREREHFETALRRQADEHRHHALHDDLTGLPNRRSLYERLDAEMAAASPDDGFSLLLVDLDRFKEVNDVLGHQSGDDLLCQVAARFAKEVRSEDLLARLGGDEFAVLVGGRHGAQAGLELARRLSGALCQEFILSGVPVHVEASIGIARYPVDGCDATALLRCADSAMYAAKDLSTELELFDGERDHHSPTRLKRLGELRQALDRDELLLHYQPKLRLETRTIPGVEALVRWQHPEQGLLLPGEFVPLAEQTGLIKPLTSFVLRRALEQVAAWQRGGYDLSIAVNVSERSLLDPDFPGEVARLLSDAGVAPTRLELEITEGTIMAASALRVVRPRLRRAFDKPGRELQQLVVIDLDDLCQRERLRRRH